MITTAILALTLAQSTGLEAGDLRQAQAYSPDSVIPGWLPQGFKKHEMSFFEDDEPGTTFEFRQPGVNKSLTVQTASGGIGDVILMSDNGDDVRVERRVKAQSKLLGKIEFETGRFDGRRYSAMNWVDRKAGKLRFVSAMGSGVEAATFKRFVESLKRAGG
jgi:hypothetical protein